MSDSQYTEGVMYRLTPQLAKGFKARCASIDMSESAIVRAMMAGFISGAIDLVVSGTVTHHARDPKQASLPGMTAPRTAKRKTKSLAGKRASATLRRAMNNPGAKK